jgi:NTE family protein
MAAQNTPNPTATAHGIATFAPLPQSERSGIGVCLSGGGYRAALFHLGVLRRFNELGILAQVTTISSVSGGSIISAYLATKIAWPLAGPVLNWEDSVSAPFRKFTSTNIRTGALLKSLLPWVRAVDALASKYEAGLTQLKLAGIPAKPNFILCATDLALGVNWQFERDRIGDYQAGYVVPTPPTWPLGLAVAASSCFPPVFNPLPVGLKPSRFGPGKFPRGPKRDQMLSAMRLSDGGVYDNLGLEPVWRNHKVVLSSDGGALFAPEADRNIFGWVKRYVSIPENQALALRKRWLISNFLNETLTGTYCGLGGLATNYGNPAAAGYGRDLVENFIATIRTDLDSFSDAEAAILENHGYCLADAAAGRHLPSLISSSALTFSLPHPNWMNEEAARKALENSWRRTLVGRGWL